MIYLNFYLSLQVLLNWYYKQRHIFFFYSMLRFLPFFIHLFIPFLMIIGNSHAQPKAPVIIQRMITEKNPIKAFWQRQKNGVIRPYMPAGIIPSKLRTERFYLAKNSKGLFFGIDGTGILFELKVVKDTIQALRVDSTYFSGNTFNASYFNHRDTIYSYGGYGFWKTNGLLRKFDHMLGEWEALKLNKELSSEFSSTGQTFTWTDEKENKMWLFQREIHEIFNNDKRNLEQKIYCLDLSTKKWQDLGKIIESGHQIIIHHDEGVLRIKGFEGDGEFWNFRDNTILLPDSETVIQCKKMFKGITPNLAFAIGNWIFYGNDEANTLDSFKIDLAKFNESKQKIYLVDKDSNIQKSLSLLIIGISSLVIYRKRKKIWVSKKSIPASEDQMETKKVDEEKIHSELPFNELEIALIKKIYLNTVQKGSISIEEINKTLGLSSKNLAVQKKNRNEIINRINTKWQVYNSKKDLLIQKQRSDFDKRNFEYYISEIILTDRWMALLIKGN
jgi:hypothetical protein